ASYDRFEKCGDAAGSAQALCYLGVAGIFGGAFELTYQTYQRAVQKAREAGDMETLALALFFCGDVLGPNAGRYAQARPFFEEALACAGETGNDMLASYAQWGLCRVAIAAGEL